MVPLYTCTHLKCLCVCVIQLLYVTHTLGLLHVRITTNGASPHLKRSFTYAWAPFNQSAHSLDWVALTTAETTYEHARLHRIQKDDSLSYFLATLSSIPAARAMVLVNYENTLEISSGEKFACDSRRGQRSEGVGVPVLVVTSETGAELARLVTEHPRGVEVRVELGSSSGETASSQSSWSNFARKAHMCIHTVEPL